MQPNPITYICQMCNKEFIPKNRYNTKKRTPKYCSIACSIKNATLHRKSKTGYITYICEYCHKEFYRKYQYKYHPNRFCSRQCNLSHIHTQPITEEVRKKISIVQRNREHKVEEIEKMRKSKLGKVASQETKNKMKIAHLGKTMSQEARRKVGLYHKGKKLSGETKQKISEANSNPSQKTRMKMRLAHINYLEKCKYNGGQISPCFNLIACNFFSEFDKTYNINGQYATNGGEYQIKELGFFLDYICPDIKLIIEFDENYHYSNDQLKEKDQLRQNEIMQLYPDFRFIRIREKYLEHDILSLHNARRMVA